MCTRSGVECVSSQPRSWRNQGLTQARRISNSVDRGRSPKRVRISSPAEQSEGSGRPSPTGGNTGSPTAYGRGPAGDERVNAADKEPWRSSSSTMMLVEEVRNQTYMAPVGRRTNSFW